MKTVLLVDDSTSIRNIVKVFLSASPYEIVEAEHGERALQLLKLLKVDLVLADLTMPVMDGLALTRAMRESTNARIRTLPLVLLTGEFRCSDEEALAAGVTAVLRKPITGRSLVNALESALATVQAHGTVAAG